MTDIPTAANLEDYLILAQRVELLVSSSSSGSSADDKFTAMRDMELEIIHPETRINHGMKKTYGHGSPDIGIRCTLSITQNVIAYLRIRGIRNSNGALPVHKYAMKVTSNNTTPNNSISKTITVNGKLTEKRYIKEDVDQGQPTDVKCFIRVTDDAEPTAT